MSQDDQHQHGIRQKPTPVYYQPPAEHENHYQQMVKWLAISLTSLFVLACLFIVFADRILIYLPFSAEKKFVKPYEDATRYLYSDEHGAEREAIETYLDQLTADLATNMDLPEDMQIEVHYLDSDAVNAFATLGGHVFICRGLLETLDDENSLAMVISHEIAHVKNRDPIVGMARGLTIAMLYSYFTGDYSSLDVSGLGSELGLSYFSREQERKADELGIQALHEHYGHVAGYDSLFSALQVEQENNANDDSQSVNWFSSHPDLDERINSLSEQARTNNWQLRNEQAYPENIIEALNIINIKKQEIDLGIKKAI
ncbi:MAG: Zn-dependent protease with chaperone function [Glaciecola sp.]